MQTDLQLVSGYALKMAEEFEIKATAASLLATRVSLPPDEAKAVGTFLRALASIAATYERSADAQRERAMKAEATVLLAESLAQQINGLTFWGLLMFWLAGQRAKP